MYWIIYTLVSKKSIFYESKKYQFLISFEKSINNGKLNHLKTSVPFFQSIIINRRSVRGIWAQALLFIMCHCHTNKPTTRVVSTRISIHCKAPHRYIVRGYLVDPHVWLIRLHRAPGSSLHRCIHCKYVLS